MRLSLISEQFDLAGCHVGPRDDFNAGRQALPLSCCRDQPSSAELEVLHALPQSGHGVVVHSGTEFDLDR